MKSHSFPILPVLACVTFFSMPISAIAQNATPRYKLTDLGAVSGYPYSRAYGINNKGQVVGQVAKLEPQLEAHAVLWNGDKVEDVIAPEGLKYTVSHAINDVGQMVGGAEIQNYGSHGFNFMGMEDQAYLCQDGKMTVLSSDSSHAYAVNEGGQVVGEVGRKAVLWEKGAATALATTPDFLTTSARAINKGGQVAGIGLNAGKRQAIFWSEGKIQSLGSLPGYDQGIANAINDSGVVVGSSGKNNSYWDLPFIWEKGTMEILSPLEGRVGHNEVLGINNRNQIVGCGLKDGAYMHAVLWENTFPQDLNDLIPAGSGLTLMKATAINDKGQIVGEARDSKVQIHAFLLTPIDAPKPTP